MELCIKCLVIVTATDVYFSPTGLKIINVASKERKSWSRKKHRCDSHGKGNYNKTFCGSVQIMDWQLNRCTDQHVRDNADAHSTYIKKYRVSMLRRSKEKVMCLCTMTNSEKGKSWWGSRVSEQSKKSHPSQSCLNDVNRQVLRESRAEPFLSNSFLTFLPFYSIVEVRWKCVENIIKMESFF